MDYNGAADLVTEAERLLRAETNAPSRAGINALCV